MTTDKDILIIDLHDISRTLSENGHTGWCRTIERAITALKSQPEIVYCDECKYGREDICNDDNGNIMYRCNKSNKFSLLVPAKFYCRSGKRKE